MGAAEHEGAHVLAAYEALRDVDVVHDHTVLGPLVGPPWCARTGPIVTTLHGPWNASVQRVYCRTGQHAALVAISRSQRDSMRGLPFAAVIHHGVDVDLYREGPGGGGYLLFVGRMNPDKGVHRAVRIARDAGLPLIVVTKMWEQPERDYFDAQVRPLLHDGVELRFDTEPEERVELLRHAEALLDPIDWPEPFGLAMAEALACGTPVLVSPRGAAPEIVVDGVTGFLRESDAELVEAAGRVGELSRQACREAAVRDFSVERMVRDHELLYERLIDSHCPSTSVLGQASAPAAVRGATRRIDLDGVGVLADG
jgi:glycosyltransferase involved in cell wall biosynthesis